MSDSEDEVQSRTVKITVVGEPSTGKVSKSFIYNFILFHTKIVWPFVHCKFKQSCSIRSVSMFCMPQSVSIFFLN